MQTASPLGPSPGSSPSSSGQGNAIDRVILPPPAGLGSLIHYFHVEAAGDCIARLPASPFPIVTVVIAGGIFFQDEDGRWQAAGDAFVGGPFRRPLQYRALPNTVFATALICPGHAADVFRVPQHELTDTFRALDELADRDSVRRLVERMRSASRASLWAGWLGDWLHAQRASAHARKPLIEPLPLRTVFHDPMPALRQCGIGVRQFERKFTARYGLSLREARRLVRFTNLLSSVMSGASSSRSLSDISQDHGYFDQAHMTRDFVALAGSPPGRLCKAAAEDPEMKIFRYSRSEIDLIRTREREEPWLGSAGSA